MAFKKNRRLKEILEDPKAEIVHEYIPGFGQEKHDPMFMMASKMTPREHLELAPDKLPMRSSKKSTRSSRKSSELL